LFSWISDMPSLQPGVLMPAVFVGACWLGMIVSKPDPRPWPGRQDRLRARQASVITGRPGVPWAAAIIGSVLKVMPVWLYDMTVTSHFVGAK
jgi:hypothetical protein